MSKTIHHNEHITEHVNMKQWQLKCKVSKDRTWVGERRLMEAGWSAVLPWVMTAAVANTRLMTTRRHVVLMHTTTSAVQLPLQLVSATSTFTTTTTNHRTIIMVCFCLVLNEPTFTQLPQLGLRLGLSKSLSDFCGLLQLKFCLHVDTLTV